VRIQPELTLFNALNNLAAYNFRSLSYGTSSYVAAVHHPAPRILRLGNGSEVVSTRVHGDRS